MEFNHTSVLLHETMDLMNIKPGGIYADCTLGGAGHSLELLRRGGDSVKLIGIDRDQDALSVAGERLAPYSEQVTLVHSNYSDIKRILSDLGVEGLDGCMLDLGVSSYQLDTPERGFSYMHDAPLDMRMDTTQFLSAYQVVNEYSQKELCRIIRDYGEEQWAARIAQLIVEERERRAIQTTGELVNVIKKAIPVRARKTGSHPAKRTFQAIRIEVNNEIGLLEKSLRDIVDCLNPGGRLCVISFHSLEDRVVKQVIRSLEKPCTCPPKAPICTCGKVQKLRSVSKLIIPGEKEMQDNPRSKSAKLRCAERV
ncbi:MAG: 16S rRNA (cytosine(1402)-N(4))-methyltransferase RsmH [Firmicutes bacterium]|nr:16S rRNA (cytosine(1402)-N(4))-methyltransferase RsmH [Bacillota bacterium]